jgi:hypothetical protein
MKCGLSECIVFSFTNFWEPRKLYRQAACWLLQSRNVDLLAQGMLLTLEKWSLPALIHIYSHKNPLFISSYIYSNLVITFGIHSTNVMFGIFIKAEVYIFCLSFLTVFRWLHHNGEMLTLHLHTQTKRPQKVLISFTKLKWHMVHRTLALPYCHILSSFYSQASTTYQKDLCNPAKLLNTEFFMLSVVAYVYNPRGDRYWEDHHLRPAWEKS